MNILFLCDEYPPCQHGGIGTITQTLSKELISKGNNVFVCGFYPYYRKSKKYEIDSGVKIFRKFYGNKIELKLSKNKWFGKFVNIEEKFYKYTQYLQEFIKENKIDVIEIPDFNEAFRYSGTRIIKFPKFKIPVIIKLHGTYSITEYINTKCIVHREIFLKEMIHINSATKIVAVSQHTKNIVKRVFECERDIDVIYNGIPLNADVNYSYKNDNKTVVFAGTLAKTKGVDNLIKAWIKVHELIPNAKLELYGKGNNSTITSLTNLLPSSVRQSVNFMGFVRKERLLNIYQNAACAVFPSFMENFSLAPMESMSVGCPTIFTKNASGPELINDGINGILVDPEDINAIANAIILLLIEREKASFIGKNARNTIMTNFNSSNLAEAHIGLYKSVIKEYNGVSNIVGEP